MDLYQQAANKFKMAKKWNSAGHAFTELATLHSKAGSRLDAATNFVEAGNCYKKTDPNGMYVLCCSLSVSSDTMLYHSPFAWTAPFGPVKG